MGLRTFFANLLPDLKFSQTRNQPRPKDEADEQRGDTGVCGAEGDVLEDVQYAQRRPVPVERVQEFVKNVVQHRRYGSMLENAARKVLIACSSLTPREPLIRTTSPFLTVRASRSPACTESRIN